MADYQIRALETSVPVEEYVKTCVDVEKFLGFCRQCQNFGKIWACPPLPVDPMEIWKSYSTLRLYARVITPGTGADPDDFFKAFREEKIKLSREVLELEERIPGSLSMAAGTCLACSTCTRPEGKPCRHPEQVRFSMEAMGGDVAKTMETYLHLPLQWMQAGQLPEYMTLVAGLLVK